MDAMVSDHKEDIKKFERVSEKAKDADLKKSPAKPPDPKGAPQARRKRGATGQVGWQKIDGPYNQ